MPRLEPTILGTLYRKHAAALRLYARQWHDSADDLIQSAFVSLAQQNPPPEQILPWLYRVVRNEALTVHRSTTRRRQREQRASAQEVWFSSVDDQLDTSEATRILVELPVEVREVIIARLWGGLTFDEIAVLVGCSRATAQRRYEAGLAELRVRLEGQCTPIPKTT